MYGESQDLFKYNGDDYDGDDPEAFIAAEMQPPERWASYDPPVPERRLFENTTVTDTDFEIISNWANRPDIS